MKIKIITAVMSFLLLCGSSYGADKQEVKQIYPNTDETSRWRIELAGDDRSVLTKPYVIQALANNQDFQKWWNDIDCSRGHWTHIAFYHIDKDNTDASLDKTKNFKVVAEIFFKPFFQFGRDGYAYANFDVSKAEPIPSKETGAEITFDVPGSPNKLVVWNDLDMQRMAVEVGEVRLGKTWANGLGEKYPTQYSPADVWMGKYNKTEVPVSQPKTDSITQPVVNDKPEPSKSFVVTDTDLISDAKNKLNTLVYCTYEGNKELLLKLVNGQLLYNVAANKGVNATPVWKLLMYYDNQSNILDMNNVITYSYNGNECRNFDGTVMLGGEQQYLYSDGFSLEDGRYALSKFCNGGKFIIEKGNGSYFVRFPSSSISEEDFEDIKNNSPKITFQITSSKSLKLDFSTIFFYLKYLMNDVRPCQ